MSAVRKYIFALCVFALSSLELFAQKEFNAMDYTLQKRHTPDNELFVNNTVFDNSFISVYAATAHILPVQGMDFTSTSSFGLQLGKWLDHNNGVRMTFTGESFIRNTDNRRISSYGADASYLFNLSSYLWGYRQLRFCDVSAVAGAGYRASFLGNELTHVGNMHIGLNATLKTGRNVDLFVEPLLYMMSDEVLHFNKLNWRGYNLSPELKIGLNYTFIPKETARPKIRYGKGLFVSLSAGAQFQHSSTVYRTVGLAPSLGPHFALSVGKRYYPYFALRTSAFGSNDIWGSYLGEFPLSCYYTGVRIEAMCDALRLFKNIRDNFPLSLSLLLGPEFGIIFKKDMSQNVLHSYFGLSGGMQVKFRIINALSVFVEPRFSVVPYSHPNYDNLDVDAARTNYFDLLFNLNAGVAFDIGSLSDT